MSTIASLNVDLALNSAKFVEGLRKARKEQDDFVGQFKELGDKAGEFAEALGVRVSADFSLAGAVERARDVEESQAKLAAVLLATGQAAGYSAQGMEAMAGGLAKVTVFSRDAARSAETVLATFTSIRGAEFHGALKAAADLATVFNVDLSTAATKVGRALENPLDGLKNLGKMGVQFTEQQKAVIKALVDVGDTAGAQEKILSAINAKVGGSAEAMAKTAGGALHQLKNAYDDVAAAIGQHVLPVVNAAEGAVNTFTAAAKTVSEVIKLWTDRAKTLAAVQALLNVVTNPASLPILLASIAAVYAAIHAYDAENDKLAAETSAHDKVADAAKQHAAALQRVADAAEKAAQAQNDLIASLIKSAGVSGQSPLWKQIQDEVDRLQAKIEAQKGLINSGHGTKEQFDAFNAQVNQFKDLQRALDTAKAKDAAEEATRQHDELARQADSVRAAIATPIQEFNAAIKLIERLISNGLLSRDEGDLAGRKALADFVRRQQASLPESPTVAAGALARGSVAAYSAALENQRAGDRNSQLLDVSQKALSEARDQNKTLIDIRNGVLNIKMPTEENM